jgi:hypothetical protein
MRSCSRTFGLLLLVLLWTSTAMGQAVQPGYIPPDAAQFGLQAHNQHLAVIQTNCATMDEAVAMRNELTRTGALVSLFTSPQFMLAWVPPEAKSAVQSTKAPAAMGSIGVVSVSYSSAEYRSQQGANQTMAALTEADEAILDYIDFIKKPLTEEEKERIRKAEEEMAIRSGEMPAMDCMKFVQLNEPNPRERSSGYPQHRHRRSADHACVENPRLCRAYSFFVESKSGTGTWNWDATIYNRYRNFYIAGMNYWASFTARYGRTLTTHWRLYSPSSSYTQVTGEPTTTGEHAFIPEIVKKFYTPSGSNKPPHGTGPTQVWNTAGGTIRKSATHSIRTTRSAASSPTNRRRNEAIWPHASSITWGGTEKRRRVLCHGYTVLAMRTRPFSKPMRNVIAHELGHLWGSPRRIQERQLQLDLPEHDQRQLPEHASRLRPARASTCVAGTASWWRITSAATASRPRCTRVSFP